MSLDTMRTKIIASLWQAVAQSEVNLSILPQSEQDKLMNRLADHMMVTFDSLLEEATDDRFFF